MEKQTASTSAWWCSSRGQHLEEVSSQGSVQSGMDWLTCVKTELLRDPVYYVATGKASAPGRAHYRRAGAPTWWMTAHPTKKQAHTYICRYVGHVVSAIEKSDLDQVMSRKRPSSI